MTGPVWLRSCGWLVVAVAAGASGGCQPTPTPPQAAPAIVAPAAAVPIRSAEPAPTPVVDARQQRKAKLLAEVVLRLTDADLASDAETRLMVDRALDGNRGTAAFVEIAAAFALKDRDDDLLRIATDHPAEAFGAQALRLVLSHRGTAEVAKALQERDAAAMATALGNANDQRAIGLLAPIVADHARDLPLRQEAVRALGKYEAGAMALLELCKQKTLPAELLALAAGVLASAPWDAVRAAVQQAMPAPAAADAKLPPIHELAAKTGDAAHGEQVFAAFCMSCHQVAGRGIDFGPNLSEIGSKLGKDGLYLAILYPDAGIEFNFETTRLALRDGNSAIGIVVSDTDAAVAIKSIGGLVTSYPVADITSRTRQVTSSMPTGLQGSLRQRDLVDLVEYLATLQKR